MWKDLFFYCTRYVLPISYLPNYCDVRDTHLNMKKDK